MKAILTGLGGRGLYWLSCVRERNDVEVVAFVEPFESSRMRAIEQHNVPRDLIFDTLEQAIAHSQADFILDVTPPAIHHEIAYQAFDAGLHILSEKPLSNDFGTAQRVVEAGMAAGVKHMVTQNYRFGSQARTSRKVLQEGIIGLIGQCDVRFYMPWADIPGSHYVTQPYMLINDMMVHHFDLMRYVLDEEPESVQAITWNQPWGWHSGDACHAIIFKFPSGLVATHICVGCDVGQQTSANGDWHITGSKGSLDWDMEGTWYSRLHRTQEKILRRPIEPLEVKAAEQQIVDEFFAAIREEREPECSARDHLKSLSMVFAAVKSAREGRSVLLSEH